MARQRIMEEERVRAVEAYRHLKKQKQQQDKARIIGLEKLKNLEWLLMALTSRTIFSSIAVRCQWLWAAVFRYWHRLYSSARLCVLCSSWTEMLVCGSSPQCRYLPGKAADICINRVQYQVSCKQHSPATFIILTYLGQKRAVNSNDEWLCVFKEDKLMTPEWNPLRNVLVSFLCDFVGRSQASIYYLISIASLHSHCGIAHAAGSKITKVISSQN